MKFDNILTLLSVDNKSRSPNLPLQKIVQGNKNIHALHITIITYNHHHHHHHH